MKQPEIMNEIVNETDPKSKIRNPESKIEENEVNAACFRMICRGDADIGEMGEI